MGVFGVALLSDSPSTGGLPNAESTELLQEINVSPDLDEAGKLEGKAQDRSNPQEKRVWTRRTTGAEAGGREVVEVAYTARVTRTPHTTNVAHHALETATGGKARQLLYQCRQLLMEQHKNKSAAQGMRCCFATGCNSKTTLTLTIAGLTKFEVGWPLWTVQAVHPQGGTLCTAWNRQLEKRSAKRVEQHVGVAYNMSVGPVKQPLGAVVRAASAHPVTRDSPQSTRKLYRVVVTARRASLSDNTSYSGLPTPAPPGISCGTPRSVVPAR